MRDFCPFRDFTGLILIAIYTHPYTLLHSFPTASFLVFFPTSPRRRPRVEDFWIPSGDLSSFYTPFSDLIRYITIRFVFSSSSFRSHTKHPFFWGSGRWGRWGLGAGVGLSWREQPFFVYWKSRRRTRLALSVSRDQHFSLYLLIVLGPSQGPFFFPLVFWTRARA